MTTVEQYVAALTPGQREQFDRVVDGEAMSQENVEVVRLHYSAMGAQDVVGATRLTHPDMESASDTASAKDPYAAA